jgi:hypothetical protein
VGKIGEISRHGMEASYFPPGKRQVRSAVSVYMLDETSQLKSQSLVETLMSVDVATAVCEFSNSYLLGREADLLAERPLGERYKELQRTQGHFLNP